ncbi:MAG: hypothetical protein K0V04_08585 [Deltaproteobacteria bacterium]|nr:hypothetical protein [Deltaproteobacteria bacterium]
MSLRPSTLGTALRPSRALLHPLWIGSLAVLVLNDHVLKGAGMLPEVLTGKLSDFAGLVVAPILLAMVLRVRTRRGVLLSHVAVGAVFAALQLSSVVATQWSAAMATLGIPWITTQDATDLIALPALGLSLWAFRRVIAQRVHSPARRSAELVAAGTGLLCCAATSSGPGEPFRLDPVTDVYVHNAGDQPLVVRFRALAPSVDLDCNAVANDPGGLITEPLFGDSQSFLLDPDQNLGLRVNNEWDDVESSSCYAMLLDVDGLPPAVAFWRDGAVPLHTVPALGYDESPRGGIDLLVPEDGDSLGEYDNMGSETVVFSIPPAAPPIDGACAPQSDATRLDWSNPPTGTWEVFGIERGADGCFSVDLGTRNTDGEPNDSQRWYLCAPLTDLQIEPGRRVQLDNVTGSGQGDGGISLRTIDGGPDDDYIELRAFRGDVFPMFHGLQIAAVPEFECGYVVGERCGTITRSTAVTAGGGDFGVTQLLPGSVETLEGEGSRQMTVAVAHAEERAALDPECAEGPDTLGLDLEVVAILAEPSDG